MFLRRVARIGVVNSLAQLVLKLGAPGVVDVYQGAELWDLNLVDPDNRRPVDFERRAKMLDALEPLLCHAAAGQPGVAASVRRLLDEWPAGAIKLLVTAAGLRLRRDHPELFATGRYEPLEVDGPLSDHVVAYLRSHEHRHVVVVAPRFVSGMMDDEAWPLGSEAWGGADLRLPDALAGQTFHNILTGESVQAAEHGGLVTLRMSQVLHSCPVGAHLVCHSSIVSPGDRLDAAVAFQLRSTSATLHACAIQPRAVCGARASKISEIEPTPKLAVSLANAVSSARASAWRSGFTRRHASRYGPMSQAQTVPW